MADKQHGSDNVRNSEICYRGGKVTGPASTRPTGTPSPIPKSNSVKK